jgi:hypothetical protein
MTAGFMMNLQQQQQTNHINHMHHWGASDCLSKEINP